MNFSEAQKKLEALVKTINEKCPSLLDDFSTLPIQENTFKCNINIADSVLIGLWEVPNCENHVISRTIAANLRMIDLIKTTNQKLEKLKKELNNG